MRVCLHCKKDFEEKRETAKFCSTSCRVMYNRKGKKQAAKTNVKVTAAPIHDKALSFAHLEAQNLPGSKYEQLAKEIDEAPDLAKLEAIGRKISSSGLDWRLRQQLQNFGSQIAKQKFSNE